jgi:hypothetical protein
MPERIRILMPTHLFPALDTSGGRRAAVVLDPVFFTGPDGSFRVHKGKLAYLLAAADEYARRHRGAVAVVPPSEVEGYYRSLSKRRADVAAYDPLDRFAAARLLAHFPGLVFDRHPGFVLDPQTYSGPLRLTPVYKAAREAAGIMVGEPSRDKANRTPPDAALAEFRASRPRRRMTAALRRAVAAVEAEYPTHFGNAAAAAYYPTTRRSALARLRAYVKNGLGMMTYQDAMIRGRPFLAHSALSAAINAGLIHPKEVCQAVADAAGASVSDREGFVRQVLGWRELVRLHYSSSPRHALFETFPRPKAAWYTGRTGLDPFDDMVRCCADTAYAHHIARLMIALNLFVMTGHSAGGMYRWFTEVVAIDAYDWVMVGNIAIMASLGSSAAHKPYVSGSAYIHRMSSGFGGGGAGWRERWDALFYRHAAGVAYFKRVLRGKRYRGARERWAALGREAFRRLGP